MLRQLLSASALILTTSGIASANIVPNGMNSAIASDSEGNLHQINKSYTDGIGDVAIEVYENNSVRRLYWIRCGIRFLTPQGNETDYIATRYRDGSSGNWAAVDHRLMEGYYADLACDRVS